MAMGFQVIEAAKAAQDGAGLADCKAIIEDAHFDTPPSEAIVAMGHCVDDCLTHRKRWILWAILAPQPRENGLVLDLLPNAGPQSLDDLSEGAVELLTSLVAWQSLSNGRQASWKAHQHGAALRQETLWIPAKKQQAGDRNLSPVVHCSTGRQDVSVR
jgi:hypothetical protein